MADPLVFHVVVTDTDGEVTQSTGGLAPFDVLHDLATTEGLDDGHLAAIFPVLGAPGSATVTLGIGWTYTITSELERAAMPEITDKQLRLVKAAEELWAEHGDKGLTVRQIADRAGVTTGVEEAAVAALDALIDGLFLRLTSGLTVAVNGGWLQFWEACLGRPALLRLARSGAGPGGRNSEVEHARGRLLHDAGGLVAREALWGLIDGEISRRVRFDDGRRADLVRHVRLLGRWAG